MTMNKFKNSKTFRIIISILVAFILWFYVDNIDTTPREIRANEVPVVFIGEDDVLMERGLMMASCSTTSVDLVLSGTRSILAKLDTDDLFLQVNLTGITTTGQHSLNYTIIYPDSITSNMVSIKYASAERVTVDIVELYSKSIEVQGKRTGSAADGYIAGEMSFDTDTIIVSGEQLAVSNISHALVTVDLNGATDNIVTVVEFQLIDFNGAVVDKSQFRTNVETVQVTVPILQIKELPLEIDFVESPGSTLADIDFDIYPRTVTVAGTKSSLAKLDHIVLTEINLSEVTQDTTFTQKIPLPSGAVNLSGEVEADVTISFKDSVTTKTYTVTNISYTNEPEDRQVEIVTREVDVTLRGSAEVLDSISDYNIRLVGDMQDIAGSSGSYAIPATVYVDGTDEAGAIGTYQITVRVSS